MSGPSENPLDLFRVWYNKALQLDVEEPTSVTLATADREGMPSARVVLLKDFDEQGFVIYTNLESRKGQEIAENPRAALCFHWMALRRQVRISGMVERIADDEADRYFASRPRQSRIGAWASRQSRPLDGLLSLEKRVAAYASRWPVGEIPRPEFWSGLRIVPGEIEFWEHRPWRLHERRLFQRSGPAWESTRLYP